MQKSLNALARSESSESWACLGKQIGAWRIRLSRIVCCLAWLLLLPIEAQDISIPITRTALPEPGYYLTGTIDISEAQADAVSDSNSGGNEGAGALLKFATTVNNREQVSALWTVELGGKIWYLLELARETRQIDGPSGLIQFAPTHAHLSGNPHEAKAIVSGWWNDQPLVVVTNGRDPIPRLVFNLIESRPGLPIAVDWKLIGEGDEETEYEKWSRLHFGVKDADPTGDSDKDGVSNWDEFLAGTDPWDSQDFLNIESVRLDEQGRFEIRWRSSPGRKYKIWKRIGVDSEPTQILVPDIKETENGMMQFTGPDSGDGEPVFYRIEAVHPGAVEIGE